MGKHDLVDWYYVRARLASMLAKPRCGRRAGVGGHRKRDSGMLERLWKREHHIGG